MMFDSGNVKDCRLELVGYTCGNPVFQWMTTRVEIPVENIVRWDIQTEVLGVLQRQIDTTTIARVREDIRRLHLEIAACLQGNPLPRDPF